MFLGETITLEQVREMPIRLLALLGDAVFELYERERQIIKASCAKQMHHQVSLRVNANMQAVLLDRLTGELNESELELIRQARNLKPSGFRKIKQSAYRRATAFEALIGYLYLTNQERLKQILAWTARLENEAILANDSIADH